MKLNRGYYSLSDFTQIPPGYLSLEETLAKYEISGGLCIHAGAHKLQELELYKRFNLCPRIWIEAIPELVLAAQIEVSESGDDYVNGGALWSSTGLPINFNIAKADYSSSILPMKLHKFIMGSGVREVISLRSVTLDDLIGINFSNLLKVKLLVLDLQGVELQVLQGASHLLEITEFIYTEVSLVELYKGQQKFTKIDTLLRERGFSLIDFEINHKYGDGNALYRNNRQHLAFNSGINLIRLENGYRFLKLSFLYDWVFLAAKFRVISFLLFIRNRLRELVSYR